MRSVWAWISAAMLVAGEARAQGVAWISDPSMDPNSTPTVEGTGVPAPGEVTLVNHLTWETPRQPGLTVYGRFRDVWSLQVGIMRSVALGVQVPLVPTTLMAEGGAFRGPGLGDTRISLRWSGLNAGSVLAASPPLSSVRCGGRCGRGWSVGGALAAEVSLPGDAPEAGYGLTTFRAVGQLEVRYLRFAIGANVTYLGSFDRAESVARDRFTASLSVRRPMAALLAMFSLFYPPLADIATVLTFAVERVLGSPYLTLTASFEGSLARGVPTVIELGYGIQRQVGSFVFSLGGVSGFGDAQGERATLSVGWRMPEDEDHDGVVDEDDRCIGVRGNARDHGCPAPDDPIVHDRDALNGRTHVYEVP
ncbi:MAG: hypothetical protein U0325_35085 [Polyangiales bacterium]